MKKIIQLLSDRFREHGGISGAVVYHNETPFATATDGFDMLVLVVTERNAEKEDIFHYIKEGFRIQERWLDASALEAWIYHGENRSIIRWILNGDIVNDRKGYLNGIKTRLDNFPFSLREQKMLLEFSRFLSKYLQSREFLNEDHLLDAYSQAESALHHWARIAIIEAGFHPEVTVWGQIKRINPEVYKLYDELLLSQETLKQRIELVLLACEFSVLSKMESCCSLLLRIVGETAGRAWSVCDLQEHPQLAELPLNFPVLLSKLVKKSLLREKAAAERSDFSDLELRYVKA